MAQLYFSLLTTAGRIKLAASAAGGPAVTITHFAIGDGNGAETNPTAASTALVREVWRTAVESVQPDPLNPAAVLVTAIIPTAQGGWWMREFGIFDNAGTMIAVAKPVSQYKPTAAEGQLEDIRYEFQIVIGETANVTLLVDPSILLASREWVETRKTPINRLLQVPWLPLKSMSVTVPPAGPAAGDVYLVPAGATGAWAGQNGRLAEWTGQAWALFTAPDGHGVSLPDGRIFERVAGTYVEKVALDTQSGKWSFAVAGGTANALTATLDPAPTAYVAGMRVRMKVPSTNTGAMTLNLNGLGAKGIGRKDGADLVAGSVVANQILDLVYDGARFQALDVVGGSGAFAIGAIRQMTASGTYTTPVGCRAIMVEGLGGGGAGGGAAALTGGNTLSVGGGGGAGGYFRKLIINPAASYAVTIGIGGAAVVGAFGNPGQTTSFGSVASATGGTGGATSTIASGGSNTSNGGSGGTAAGGDVSSGGSSGGPAVQITSGSGFAGIGAAGALGGAGVPSGSTLNPGGNATGFGSGGGGAVINGSGYPSQPGGSGSPGVVIITEYF